MTIKRHGITREVIIKANRAMIEGKSIDYSKMPAGVATIIRKNKPSATDIRHAFAKARQKIETTSQKW